MTQALRTRPATAADQAAVWAMYEDALRGHIEAIWGWDPTWQTDHFAKAYAAMSTWLIEREGVPCGYLQLELRPAEIYLSMLVLAEHARAQGIGSAILAALVARAAQGGRDVCLRVFRVNQAAYRFYQRAGWRLEWADAVFYVMRSPAEVGTAPVPLAPADLVLSATCA